MRHFPAPLSRAESDALIERIQAHIAAHGYGLWAVERNADGALLGFTGLQTVDAALPFAPATEVGWRLVRPAWGQGYASEAAGAALDLAFGPAGLDEVVSFTTVANTRSRAVMERLGMRHDGDFEHPQLAADSPLRPHVLYRLAASDWAPSRPLSG